MIQKLILSHQNTADLLSFPALPKIQMFQSEFGITIPKFVNNYCAKFSIQLGQPLGQYSRVLFRALLRTTLMIFNTSL